MSQLNKCYNINDLRKLARRKVPSVMFDYIRGGAEDEVTLDWNRRSFNKYEFVPRVLIDVRDIDLSTEVQGVKIELPVISAPTGFTRLFHHEGEKAVAKATHAAGTAYSLSTVGTTSIEDVARISKGPNFFQIYAWYDTNMVNDFIERCRAEQYDGLMLAVDVPVFGKREKDKRNGHGTSNFKMNVAKAAIKKPVWLWNYLTSPTWRMANMVEHLPHGGKLAKVINEANKQFDPSITWDKAAELKEKWGGKFMLKGVQCVQDAVKAVEFGATGIILSNHGGRQLDGAPAMLDILPEVVSEVGDRTEVLMDGGVMRGSDVIKAIALGAKAVLIGKAYLYGLGAGGEKGVAKVYEILRDEMERTMQLIGCTSIQDLDASYVRKI